MTPLEAALRGRQEIGFTVVSISLSLVAVFIPILLMGGIVGRLFREFAVTLSVAIAGLDGGLADDDADDVRASAAPRAGAARPALPGQRTRLRRMLARYDRSRCAWVLRHPAAARSLITLATIGVNVVSLRRHPERLFPAAGHRPLAGHRSRRAGQFVSGHERAS